jgi:N-acyl-D-aspartate/D-glutamate deacylase
VSDLLIKGASVVDGTGRAAFAADVAVAGGRIVEIGTDLGPATRVVDADGLTVVPGFVDIHTHYDAQIFWDPYCTPSSLHGVTTVIAGNCGLTLAPLVAGDEDFLLGVLSRVESIPMRALVEGLDLRWRTFRDLVSVIDPRGVGINVGLVAGHTALRRAAMGPAASERAATDGEVTTMARDLAAAIEAGALGFSTSTARAHVDLHGRPTPPHFADRAEMLALAAVCRRYPGTSLEFIPGSAQDGMSDSDVALLRDMSRAAGRQINWNLLQFSRTDPELHVRQLRAGATGPGDDGSRVIALALPNNPRMRIDFGANNVGLRLVPGCEWLFELEVGELIAALGTAAVRDRIRSALGADSERVASVRTTMPNWVLTETAASAPASWIGSTVTSIGQARGTDALDTVLDIAIASERRAAFERRLYLADADVDALRASLLSDPRVVIGGSDAGAHVDAMANGEYPTAAIRELVHDRSVLGFEALVHLLTDVPARLVGLRDRGRVELGGVADLVVLDPAEVQPTPLVRRDDLPGGESRLYSGARGVHRVFVAGDEVVHHGEVTGRRPGRVLRSGVDTR